MVASARDFAQAKGFIAPPGTEIPVDFQGILTGKLLSGITIGDATSQVLIPQLARLGKSGELPLHRFTKYYRLDKLDQAAHDMHSGVTVKPIIVH